MERSRATCSRTSRHTARLALAYAVASIVRRGAFASLFYVCGLVYVLISGEALAGSMRRETLVLKVSSGPIEISAEIAQTMPDQEQGLMFRTSLADTDGMLFVYDKSQVLKMWMHNTYVPLDMVFIDAKGEVARIEAGAEPLSDRVISSGSLVVAVLELNAGTAKRIGLKAGDKVQAPALLAAKP